MISAKVASSRIGWPKVSMNLGLASRMMPVTGSTEQNPSLASVKKLLMHQVLLTHIQQERSTPEINGAQAGEDHHGADEVHEPLMRIEVLPGYEKAKRGT
eukprot:CAMPEP_0170577510 /NCGR_PEP_ID=MMETSP0224-20130122/4965_1 /TAXON_ID=285029 /ORGANISM="Togula jolla, Strain CCCM 725" /LENGTH=99 /DNA_ID=CAMNT_0010900425 /DNA_START=1099 /DNA_END=1397 /DNA_ORIENTATION=+